VSRAGAPSNRRNRSFEKERNRRFVALAREQGCVCKPWIKTKLRPGESGRIAVQHSDWCPLADNAGAESLVVLDPAGLPVAALVTESSLRRPEQN
jgi:hypothetical protein